jgi:hypothetical protein
VGMTVQLLLKTSPEYSLDGIEHMFTSRVEIDADNCGSHVPRAFHRYFVRMWRLLVGIGEWSGCRGRSLVR